MNYCSKNALGLILSIFAMFAYGDDRLDFRSENNSNKQRALNTECSCAGVEIEFRDYEIKRLTEYIKWLEEKIKRLEEKHTRDMEALLEQLLDEMGESQ